MKKIILSLFFVLVTTIAFSQNYIGKNLYQIIFEDFFMSKEESNKMWLDAISLKTENKLKIHDIDNNKLITFFIQDSVCVAFTIVYYNTNKECVEKILNKKIQL